MFTSNKSLKISPQNEANLGGQSKTTELGSDIKLRSRSTFGAYLNSWILNIPVVKTRGPNGLERGERKCDWVRNCLRPLTFSMNVFGLYFDHHVDTFTDGETINRSPWMKFVDTFSRIYPGFVLGVIWLNALRILSVFQTGDKLGLGLFFKLIAVVFTYLATAMQTSAFLACRSRKLHSTLVDIFELRGCATYLKIRVKILTFVAWGVIGSNAMFILYALFGGSGFLDGLVTPFSTYIHGTEVSNIK